MEHTLVFIKMSGFTCLFVGLLEEKVVGLQDFVGTVVNIKVVDTAEVTCLCPARRASQPLWCG